MRETRTIRLFAFSVTLIAVLLAAACVPQQFPTAAAPPTGTPGADATPGEGQFEDDDQEGLTIPQTGDTGEQIPPSGDLNRFPESRPQGVPLLTVTSETVAPGQEIVVQGLGFEANSNVLIFTGRPDVGEDKQALTTAQVDEQGMFTAHAVLPVEFPTDAVTAGQLLIVAGAEDGQVLAQTVVQTGQAATAPGTQTAPPAGGEQTQQPGVDDQTEQPDGGSQTQQPEDEGDLSQLGFDFETSVLPALNQALSGNFTLDNLTVRRIERTRWPNGCLGLGGEGEFCTQQIVPGFRILVDVDGQAVEVRTNENGSQVRVSREGM